MKNILFVSHYAERTGAPLSLLQFQQWLKENSDIVFETVQLGPGALFADFQKVSKTTLCVPGRIDQCLNRVYSLLGTQASSTKICYTRFAKKMANKNIGLVYANTITNGALLDALADLHCPVICHVHELESLIQFFGKNNLEFVKNHTTRYIAVSEKVKSNLVVNHEIPADIIDVVYPYINTKNVSEPFQNTKSLCSEIPKDAFIVCGSGQGIPWIKGKDIFIQLAYILKHSYPDLPVHFLWIGETTEGLDTYLLENDIAMAGLSDRIHLVPSVENPLDYFNICDVFVLVSREESFGLAGLEAAALGKPIICFNQGGSMHELVENDAGYVVPYLNINAMAEKILELARRPDLKKSLGAKAKEKVFKRHDISVAGPSILKVIKRFL
jgi:glycosyltransferase involved in cell wall biosynthesis